VTVTAEPTEVELELIARLDPSGMREAEVR
jgi:hypothetical protein